MKMYMELWWNDDAERKLEGTLERICVRYKQSVRTLQIITFASIAERIRLMLCREIAHYDDRTEHGNKLRGRSADFAC